MSTTQELAEKVRCIIQSLDRTQEITSVLGSDLQKRIIGKSAFVLVGSGVIILRRLNNAVPATAKSPKRAVKDILNTAEEDYEKNFSLLRNKMHAHRQEVPMLHALTAWQVMHYDYIRYFRGEFLNAYMKIKTRDRALPTIKPAKPLSQRLRQRIHKATKTSDLYFNASKQGLFSSSGLSVILGGPSERGQEVIDTFDVLALCEKIELAVKGVEGYSNLVAILYLVDAISMFDALYDDQNPEIYLREPSFLDEIRSLEKTATYASGTFDFLIAALSNAKTQIDARGIRDRNLRNRLAAHIDADIPLSDLISELKGYNWAGLREAVHFSHETFRTVCECGPIFLRALAKHGTTLKGALGLEHGSPPPSYD